MLLENLQNIMLLLFTFVTLKNSHNLFVTWLLLINNLKLFHQVIAAAQAGKHNDKRESYGDTLIIDPWGKIIGRLPGKV